MRALRVVICAMRGSHEPEADRLSPDRYRSIRRYLCALPHASAHTHADDADDSDADADADAADDDDDDDEDDDDDDDDDDNDDDDDASMPRCLPNDASPMKPPNDASCMMLPLCILKKQLFGVLRLCHTYL